MKRLIVGLIIGLALGYKFGFGDGTQGRPSIVARTLDRFGTSKIRAAREANDRRIDEAGRP
jgi:hypothetical protein